MRLLVIGMDATVARPDSPSAKRQAEYYAGWEVDIVIVAPGQSAKVQIAPNVTAHLVGGSNRPMTYVRAMALVFAISRKQTFDVMTVQDPFFSGWLGLIARFAKTTGLHVQDHSGVYARPAIGLKDRILQSLSSAVMTRADRIRTVSQRGKKGLIAKGIVEQKIDVTPVATDISRFEQVILQPSAEPRIVSVGRLNWEKGMDILLQAMPDVIRVFPKTKLQILGAGPEEELLKAKAKRMGLEQQIEFLGSQSDIRPFLQQAWVYTQPSRYEGWGIAVIEAAATGLPIVMTDVGCAGEVIQNGVSGIIVPSMDAHALGQGLINMLQHRDQAMEYGRAAKQAVQRLPNFEQNKQGIRQSIEKTGQRSERSAWSIFLTAFVLRFVLFVVILFFVGQSGLMLGDSKQYIGLAQSLADGNGFMLDGKPFFFRTIGYPGILAIGLKLFRSLPFIIFLQLILASYLPLIVLRIGRALGLGERTSRIAAWMTAIEPHLIFYSVMVLTETTYTFIFLLAILSAFLAMQTNKKKYAVATGVYIGLGMLIKPLLQFFPLFLIPFFLPFWRKISWKQTLMHICIISGITGALLAPWIIHNKNVHDSTSLSNQGSVAALFYLGTSIVSVRDHISYPAAEAKVKADFEQKHGEGKTELEKNALYAKEAFSYMQQNPLIVARIFAINTFTLWTSSNYNSFLHYYHVTPPLTHKNLPPTHYVAQGRYLDLAKALGEILTQPFYSIGLLGRMLWIVLTILFVQGFCKAWVRLPKQRLEFVLIAALCAYLTATIWVDGLGIEARLRFMLIPIEFLFIAFAWTCLRPISNSMKQKKLLIITQRIDESDRNLAVHIGWLREFSGLVESIEVIAQSVGTYSLPNNVIVHSLGKEKGASKLKQALRLIYVLCAAIPRADRILVLMVPMYVVAAWPLSFCFRVPMYLWYTHKQVTHVLRLAERMVKKIFSANAESFRLKTTKVRFMGHAIDTDFFVPPTSSEKRISGRVVSTGRITPTKHIALFIDLINQLGPTYSLDIVGEAVLPSDRAYEAELKKKCHELGVQDRVQFVGGKSQSDVRTAYQTASYFVNASETGSLDKAVLEAMACECPSFSSNIALQHILPSGYFVPTSKPELFAKAIQAFEAGQLASPQVLRDTVCKHHRRHETLSRVIQEMN